MALSTEDKTIITTDSRLKEMLKDENNLKISEILLDIFRKRCILVTNKFALQTNNYHKQVYERTEQ